MDHERLQNKPNRPKMDDPRQKSVNQGEAPKTQRSETDGTVEPETTMGSPWWPLVVDARSCCLECTAVHPSCSRIFQFSSRLFDFLVVLCCKSLSFSAMEESIPFYNHSHSHRIARSRLEREFEGEEEDLQGDGGSSKNRKIKRSHLTKHFFLFSSLLFSHV